MATVSSTRHSVRQTARILDDQQMLAKALGSSRWDLIVVVDTDRIAARMLRLAMSAAGPESMEWQPAQHLTLLITRAAGREIRRRYTIAGQDTLQLDVYLHGQGIGSSWAAGAPPGRHRPRHRTARQTSCSARRGP
jgi:NADPH-dependent ferric siderophore reductase